MDSEIQPEELDMSRIDEYKAMSIKEAKYLKKANEAYYRMHEIFNALSEAEKEYLDYNGF